MVLNSVFLKNKFENSFSLCLTFKSSSVVRKQKIEYDIDTIKCKFPHKNVGYMLSIINIKGSLLAL